MVVAGGGGSSGDEAGKTIRQTYANAHDDGARVRAADGDALGTSTFVVTTLFFSTSFPVTHVPPTTDGLKARKSVELHQRAVRTSVIFALRPAAGGRRKAYPRRSIAPTAKTKISPAIVPCSPKCAR